ncbi:MAG: response regulator, partial [bacterium]|nr:response regulator [bacterium]
GVVKRKNGQDTLYTKIQGVSLDFIYYTFEDSKGRIWLRHDEGMYYFEDGRLYPSSVITAKYGLSRGLAYEVFEDSRHNLWVATKDNVLNRIHDDGISHTPPPPASKLPSPSIPLPGFSQYIKYFYEDKEHNVWVSYVNFLFCFKDEKITRIPLQDNIPVTSMAEDQKGNLWAGDATGRFYLIKDGKARPVEIPGLSNKGNNAELMTDREGLLWIGTDRTGLHRLRPVPLKSYPVAPGLSATSINQDGRGIVWIGSYKEEIYYIENGKFKSSALTITGQTAVLADSKGYRWVGGWGGLIRVKGGQTEIFNGDDRLADVRISALYEDSEKNIWIGSKSGVTIYKDGEFKTFKNSPGFKKNNTVISLLKDSRGVLWAGTRANGLYRLEDGRFTNYSTKDGLSHNAVRALYEDDTGSLWVGTYGGGLNRFKNGKFVTITTDHGLYDNVVHCILEDHLGFFWMSCNRGVYRAAKQELNDFADGKIQAVNCTYFNKADGMETTECNGGSQPSGCKTTDGKLWFPTIQGVVVFDPYEAAINPNPPPVIVEKMIVDGGEISPHSKKELSPGVKRLEFHYTGLSFPVPERVRFRFKLEGLDEDWQDVGTRRVAYYNQLPPGNYTFRVTACNNDGTWNETGTAVSFHQKPYFYQTGWFAGFCALAALLLIFSGYRLRVRQLKARAKELNRMVESRTLELAEKSEKLKEMDRIKSRFFANISHEFRTPLTLIIGPLEQRLSERNIKLQIEEMQVMLRNSRRLLTLINQLLDLSKLESGRMIFQAARQEVIPFLKGVVGSFESLAAQKNMELVLQVEQEPVVLYYDAEKLEKILVNLIANAIKFTPAGGTVTVTAAPVSPADNNKSGCLEIKVRDTGVGIPGEQLTHIFDRFYQAGGPAGRGRRGTGIGLALVKELVELHKGDVFVQSTPGEGSEFTVRLPLGKDHLKPEEIAEAPRPTLVKSIADSEYETLTEAEENTAAKMIEKEEQGKDVILVVEDNPDVRKFIRGPLQPYYNVVEAADGREGIQKAKEIIPDLIISDIMMPEADGYQLCGTLKKDIKTSHIPIILLTAKASEDSVVEGLKTGADDY